MKPHTREKETHSEKARAEYCGLQTVKNLSIDPADRETP